MLNYIIFYNKKNACDWNILLFRVDMLLHFKLPVLAMLAVLGVRSLLKEKYTYNVKQWEKCYREYANKPPVEKVNIYLIAYGFSISFLQFYI